MGPPRCRRPHEHPPKCQQQKVDVRRALVHLIDNHVSQARQPAALLLAVRVRPPLAAALAAAVALELPEKDAGRHERHQCVLGHGGLAAYPLWRAWCAA